MLPVFGTKYCFSQSLVSHAKELDFVDSFGTNVDFYSLNGLELALEGIEAWQEDRSVPFSAHAEVSKAPTCHIDGHSAITDRRPFVKYTCTPQSVRWLKHFFQLKTSV